jgi:signal peptidase II
VLLLGVAAAGVAADLVSKSMVFAAVTQRDGQPILVLPGLLRLRLSANPGIVFGLPAPPLLVVLATIGAVVVVGCLFAASDRRQRWLHAALGMVLAGCVGNAYDRLFSAVTLPGETGQRIRQVRDFLDVYPINYPIFNVADILLVVGVCILMLIMLRQAKPARRGR